MNIWNNDFKMVDVGSAFDASTEIVLPMLMKQAIRDGICVYHDKQFFLIKEEVFHKVLSKMEELGGKLIYESLSKSFYLYKFKHGMVSVTQTFTEVDVSFLSVDKSFITSCEKFLEEISFTPEPEKEGCVYAITKCRNNLQLSNLGNAGVPLTAINYMPEVLKDFDYVIKELNSEKPAGRITLLEGEPGTGKTHLIRSMLNLVPDAMFVLVSPELIIDLAGPELLPLLISNKNYNGGPLILVLEDADRCLVSRDEKNINAIQTLLNLGDGILGSMLDIRIVATTNASKLEMEKAIMRPGRLLKAIKVGSLDRENAQKVYKNLLPKAKLHSALEKESTFTLAEVYSFAREMGWVPEPRKNQLD